MVAAGGAVGLGGRLERAQVERLGVELHAAGGSVPQSASGVDPGAAAARKAGSSGVPAMRTSPVRSRVRARWLRGSGTASRIDQMAASAPTGSLVERLAARLGTAVGTDAEEERDGEDHGEDSGHEHEHHGRRR